MTGPGIRAALSVFDAAALATLANAGLVRRAARDVADGKVRLVDEDNESALVEADGAQVRIDASGPKRATCTCNAAGMCRHRLAAVLFLQTADQEAGAQGPLSSEPAPIADPVVLLDGFTDVVVERWSGKAAWRAAIEMAGQASEVAATPNGIAVTMADFAEPVLILQAQGLDGIVSKAPRARAKVVHAAAMIAARRHFGLPAGDSDQTMGAPASAIAARPDPAFLAQVEAALVDCTRFAFNLAPEPVEETLFTLSVSSRADALPRLSRLLRTIAGQLRRKRGREFSFEADTCLELLATAFALVRALGRDGDMTPERIALLHGTSRQHYAPAAPLTIICCGSDLWRTSAGARGVTGIFYDPADDRWLVAGPARGPGQDPLFSPALAYRTESLWSTQTLENAAGRQLRVEGAGISETGRLSNPAGAWAHPNDGPPSERGDWPTRTGDWARLRERLIARFGVGVRDLKRTDYALLAPSRFAAPIFEDLAQELIWPVADEAGRWLGLTIAHDSAAVARREQIEELGRRRWSGDVLVRAEPMGRRIVLTPIAVLSGEQVLSLGLDELPKKGWRSESMLGWLLSSRSRGLGRTFAWAQQHASQAALGAAWQQMIDLAEAGPEHARPSLLVGLRAGAARLDAMGMPTAAASLEALAEAPSDGFLAASYALLVARGQRRDLPWLISA